MTSYLQLRNIRWPDAKFHYSRCTDYALIDITESFGQCCYKTINQFLAS